jgi:hypothetical protein
VSTDNDSNACDPSAYWSEDPGEGRNVELVTGTESELPFINNGADESDSELVLLAATVVSVEILIV